jgi:eukaryotic-like serine/threonine-protein kinase
MPLKPGTRLGSYEIVQPIGAGGMGEVYKALDQKLGRDVAIKVLPSHLATDPAALARFEREARAVAALSHPNILGIHEFGSDGDTVFAVMELLEGETLRARLSGEGQRVVPVRKAIDYATEIARGLAAAHDKGIVHRDLKPENVFILSDGRVKILDFGLAQNLELEKTGTGTELTRLRDPTTTQPGTILGTVGYMSPEQVRGERTDQRSDIFALGVVLYEAVTGQPAFGRDSAIETMSAILKEDAPDIAPGSIPPALERIVRRCLEKNPNERFQSARDLAFALQSLSGIGAVSSSTAPAGVARTWPGVTRRVGRLAIVPAAAIVLLALGALAGQLMTWRRTEGPPSFLRLTFGRGTLRAARFAPDGQTILYSAAWMGGPLRTFQTRPESPASSAIQVPDGQLLSVSSQGELALSVGHAYDSIWTAAGTLARAPLVGGTVRQIEQNIRAADWAPDATSLAIVRRVGGRDRLEYPAGTVVYETSGYVSHPRVSPDGSRIAFLDHPFYGDNRGTVAVIEPGHPKTTLTGDWPSEEGLAWSPDGREVWFTASRAGGDQELMGVDLRGRLRAVYRAPAQLVLHDIHRDGRVLLSEEAFRGETTISGVDGVPRDVSLLDLSGARDLSHDGQFLLVTQFGASSGANYAVYLQKTDGTPAVRLGDGDAWALSPDNQWALAIVKSPASRVVLLPTGPGQPRALSGGDLRHETAEWFPDGRRVLTCGSVGGRAARCYVQDVASGAIRAVTPEGMMTGRQRRPRMAPDGRHFVAVGPDGHAALYDAEGGAATALPMMRPNEVAIEWTADGSGLFVHEPFGVPRKVFRVDLKTKARTVWRDIAPADRAGVLGNLEVLVTPDGRSYATIFFRMLSSLFLAQGLR